MNGIAVQPTSSDRGGARRNRRTARKQRQHHGGSRPHAPRIVLTEEGVPAATPDAPPASPVVKVAAESRARYPWLPARVIAGSVWRESGALRVRVDEQGLATPWKCPAVRAA